MPIHRPLLLAIALSACVACAGRAAPASDDPAACAAVSPTEAIGWRLALQAWTCHDRTLTETIQVARDLGIRYLELYPGQRFSPDDGRGVDQRSDAALRAKVKAALDAGGIYPVSYGVSGLWADAAASRPVFEFARDLGIATIVAEPPADAFDTVEQLAQEYGIAVALHDHPRPATYWSPELVLARVADRDPLLGACADLGHWVRSGLVPVDCLRQLRGRIIELHYKDVRDGRDVAYGTGTGDLAGQFAELRKQGWKGVVAIEYEGPEQGDERTAVLKGAVAFLNQAAAAP